METVLVVGYMIFCAVVLAGFPPFVQWSLFQWDIDVKYFKKKSKLQNYPFCFEGSAEKII